MKRIFEKYATIVLCAIVLTGCVGTTGDSCRTTPSETGTDNQVEIRQETVQDTPKVVWEVTEDITVSLRDSRFPVGTTELTAVFENHGAETLFYGAQLSFEKLVNGQWQSVETIENYGFNDIGYLLQGGETREFTISTWFLAQPLDAGHYRVTGSNLYIEAPGTSSVKYPPYQLEFDIVAESALFTAE